MGKGRAPCCDKTKVKKGPWSPAEDLKLIAFIQRNGHENWRSLPKLAGLARCGKSCRLRWINYLRPDVKRGNFTPEEEEKIMRLHESLGNKWSRITSYLPGRTDNEIKNVWNTHLKKRVEHTKKSREGDEQSSKGISVVTSSSSSSSSASTDTKVNNLKEVPAGSSSSTSYDVEVTRPTSCDEVVCGNTGYDNNKTRSWEEVNKPLEGDFDFWSMLDMDNLGSYVHSINDVLVQDKVVDDQNSSSFLGCSEEDEQKKWLKHLETELGLEAPKEEDVFLGDLADPQVWP